MPFEGISASELLILLLVVLLVFGPKRLPEMGRSLGRGIREFKESISGEDFPAASARPLNEPVPMTPPESERAVHIAGASPGVVDSRPDRPERLTVSD